MFGGLLRVLGMSGWPSSGTSSRAILVWARGHDSVLGKRSPLTHNLGDGALTSVQFSLRIASGPHVPAAGTPMLSQTLTGRLLEGVKRRVEALADGAH